MTTEEKLQKAEIIHNTVDYLNQLIREAQKLGLTVEIKSTYARAESFKDAYECQVGEYIAYP